MDILCVIVPRQTKNRRKKERKRIVFGELVVVIEDERKNI